MQVLPCGSDASGFSIPLLVDSLRDIAAWSLHHIHQTVFSRLVGAHPVVPIRIRCNSLHALTGVIRQKPVQLLPHEQYFLGLNLDVGRYAAAATRRLMQHHAGVRKRTRARLSSDGKFYTCLFADAGFDIRELLRDGLDDGDLLQKISAVWQRRDDRYSDERTELTAKNRNKIGMSYIGG